MTLDFLNKLDNFADVFEIEYYKNHKVEYYKWLAHQHSIGSKMNEPVYQGLLEREAFKKIAIREACIEGIKRPLRPIKRKLFK